MTWDYKNEAIHVEREFENGCFNQKSSEECHLLGRFLEIVKKNHKRAADVYKTNCRDGQNGDSCFRLAQIYHSGGEGAIDHVAAFHYNHQGCQLGHAKACLNAGMANLAADFEGCVRQDLTLAVDYLKRGCQLGSGMSCYLLAGTFNSDIPSSQHNDSLNAYKYDFEACQLNFPLACANLKDSSTSETTSSMGVIGRAKHVKSMYGTKSNKVVAMNLDPKDNRLDLEKLRMDYHFGCYLRKNPKDCHHLAEFFHTIKNDASKAARTLRENCDDNKYGPSCEKFAFFARNGKGVTADWGQSFKYDRLGCDNGQARCCFNATMAVLNNSTTPRYHADILYLLDRGCRLGCDNSCYLAGGLFLAGIPDVLESNPSATYKYDLKACQLGHELACACLSGALPVQKSTADPTTNGFFIRLMQLKIQNKRSRK